MQDPNYLQRSNRKPSCPIHHHSDCDDQEHKHRAQSNRRVREPTDQQSRRRRRPRTISTTADCPSDRSVSKSYSTRTRSNSHSNRNRSESRHNTRERRQKEHSKQDDHHRPSRPRDYNRPDDPRVDRPRDDHRPSRSNRPDDYRPSETIRPREEHQQPQYNGQSAPPFDHRAAGAQSNVRYNEYSERDRAMYKRHDREHETAHHHNRVVEDYYSNHDHPHSRNEPRERKYNKYDTPEHEFYPDQRSVQDRLFDKHRPKPRPHDQPNYHHPSNQYEQHERPHSQTGLTAKETEKLEEKLDVGQRLPTSGILEMIARFSLESIQKYLNGQVAEGLGEQIRNYVLQQIVNQFRS